MEEMKQLLFAVEQSGDPAIVSGALFASLGSRCWNVAKVKTLGKMLVADADLSDIGSRLFTLPLGD